MMSRKTPARGRRALGRDTDAPQDADQVVEHEPESNPEDPAPTDRVDDVRPPEELFFARAPRRHSSHAGIDPR